jgi:hypothetical protein
MHAAGIAEAVAAGIAATTPAIIPGHHGVSTRTAVPARTGPARGERLDVHARVDGGESVLA